MRPLHVVNLLCVYPLLGKWFSRRQRLMGILYWSFISHMFHGHTIASNIKWNVQRFSALFCCWMYKQSRRFNSFTEWHGYSIFNLIDWCYYVDSNWCLLSCNMVWYCRFPSKEVNELLKSKLHYYYTAIDAGAGPHCTILSETHPCFRLRIASASHCYVLVPVLHRCCDVLLRCPWFFLPYSACDLNLILLHPALEPLRGALC